MRYLHIGLDFGPELALGNRHMPVITEILYLEIMILKPVIGVGR